MGHYISIPLLGLAAILQSTFVPQIRILGGGPDLVFLLVLAWAFNSSVEEGVTWAFVGGIAGDLLSAAPTGTSIIGMLLVVFTAAFIQRQFYRMSLPAIGLLTAGGTLLQQFIAVTVLSLAGFTVLRVDIFSYVILPTLLYNLLAIWPIYVVMRWIQRRVSGRRRLFT